ncbi:TraR/DksA family transcriptional regulator [Sulfurovum riftiae]|uniref:Molecular chaperone DnaK n=1 Tax=Sulfurovum riftiae TaxID=1630136 RepID=A0A151CEI4_9BACT|nr:TraR/DksA family transcriptional regulator [Sulfurovum riftiae]KYJ85935.1 molecular chaperone DnaK [Sulfurovum riftiae]
MTTDQKQAFKKIIEKEISILTKEIKIIRSAVYPEKGKGPSDKVAHISFKQEQHIHLQRYDEARKRLNRLKTAYLKIDTPEYGICKECEEPIPVERLKLIPESLYCVSCMNEFQLG